MAEEKKNMPSVNDQYQRLINARNYHYDNLNKWLMSFYVIIGALLIAFYSVKDEFQVIVASVGYVVSLAAWLSGKGYYYWENIWIGKIHRFEKNILKFPDDMQVYSYNKGDIDTHNKPLHLFMGANVSTSKVTIFMTALLTMAWGFLVMTLLLPTKDPTLKALIALASSIGASYILMVIGATFLPSIEEEEEEAKNSDLTLREQNEEKRTK